MRNNPKPSRAGAKPSGRPKRAYGSRDGKPFDSERPKRSSDSERPKRSYGSRDGKPFDRERKPFDGDRPKRAYAPREDKPFDRERKPFDGDRPKRSFDSDRPKRAYTRREDKPFDRDRKPFDGDRPKRSFDSDRPKRAYGSREDKPFDRERKPFDRDRKPYDSDRPKRSFDSDRPKRAYGSRDDKPFDRERKPFDRDSKPYDSDRPKRVYTPREDKPFDSEETTFDAENTLVEVERTKRKYTRREDKPFDSENQSSEQESKPYEGEKRRKLFGEDHAERPQRDYRPKAEEYIPKPRRRKAVDEVGIRLNKFISNSGVCSRREADDYITAGLVSVNGQVITELGTKIQASDDVRFNGERLKGEEKVYILMNKPKDFVTTLSDPNAEKTVMDLIAGNCPQRVYPVGRLDKSTTGVLLLTNDGEMTEKLSHPSNMSKKIYHVFLDKNLSGSDFKALLDGVELEDGLINADSLSYIDEDKTQVGLELHSGRNRVVRRMFEHLGYRVKKLDRVFFAGLTKKNLRRGQWRFLTDQEIAMLRMGAFE
ncbi:MAG: pseudouridine synthase [Bacteroidales bacterium]|jgi:23S rRNA pseudouridine2605 synthase